MTVLSKSLRVVGMSFTKGYPDNYYRLRDLCESRQLAAISDGKSDWLDDHDDAFVGGEPEPDAVGEPVEVLLVRNPFNKYDGNAIEVHIPTLGRTSMVGHIPRDIAARLAVRMDDNQKTTAVIDAVLISPENPDNPGLSITVTVDPDTEQTCVVRPIVFDEHLEGCPIRTDDQALCNCLEETKPE